jgi:hypothetical protein
VFEMNTEFGPLRGGSKRAGALAFGTDALSLGEGKIIWEIIATTYLIDMPRPSIFAGGVQVRA